MLELFVLLADIQELRDLGLEEDELDGYIDIFLEGYDFLHERVEIV